MRLSGWPAFNYNTLLSFVGSGSLESAPSSTQSQHTSPKLVRDPTTLGNIFYITQPKVFFSYGYKCSPSNFASILGAITVRTTFLELNLLCKDVLCMI